MLLDFWRKLRDRRDRNAQAPRQARRLRRPFRRLHLEALEDRTMLSGNPFTTISNQLTGNSNQLAGDLGAVQDSVNSTLSTASLIQNQVSQIPFVGGQLGQGLDALQFIGNTAGGVLARARSALTNLANMNGPGAADVQNQFFAFFGPSPGAANLLAHDLDGSQGNVTASDVHVTGTDFSGNSDFWVQMRLHEDKSQNPASNTLDFSTGLPGIPLSVLASQGGVSVNVGFDYELAFHYTASTGSAGLDSKPLNGLGVQLAITVGAKLSNFQVLGNVGLLQATLTDADPQAPSNLTATFALDTSHNPTLPVLAGFQGQANINLHLNTSLGGNTDYPSVQGDFQVGWTFGQAPTVQFNNVSVDLGTVITSIAGPLVNDIKSALQSSRIEDVLDALNAKVPNLNISLLGVANLLDQSGAIQDPDVEAALAITNAVNTIDTALNHLSTTGGNLSIPLGGFALPSTIDATTLVSVRPVTQLNDAVTGLLQPGSALLSPDGSSLSPDLENAFQSTAPPDLGAVLAYAENSLHVPLNSPITQVVNALLTPPDRPDVNIGFTFPILDDPASCVFPLLLGEDAALAKLDISINLDTPPLEYSVPVGPVSAHLQGTLSVHGGLHMGYDTKGLREALQPGGNLSSFLDGFYVDTSSTYLDVNANLTASIDAGIPDVLDVGVGGGIFANVHVALVPQPDNKLRLNPLPNPFVTHSGEIDAGLFADIRVGVTIFGHFFGYEKQLDFAQVVLVNFGSSEATPPPVVLATLDNGQLTLNMGPQEGSRGVAAPTDGSKETWTLSDAGHLLNGSEVIDVSAFGLTQEFAGVTSIAGTADDNVDTSIVVEEGVTAGATLKGSSNTVNTSLTYLGLGTATLTGGGGDNELTGGAGSNTFHGGSLTSFDTIVAGSGSNAIYDDSGSDETISLQVPNLKPFTLVNNHNPPGKINLQVLGTTHNETFHVSNFLGAPLIYVKDLTDPSHPLVFSQVVTVAGLVSLVLDGQGGSDSTQIDDLTGTNLSQVIVNPSDLDNNQVTVAAPGSWGSVNIDQTSLSDDNSPPYFVRVSQQNGLPYQVVAGDNQPGDSLVVNAQSGADNISVNTPNQSGSVTIKPAVNDTSFVYLLATGGLTTVNGGGKGVCSVTVAYYSTTGPVLDQIQGDIVVNNASLTVNDSGDKKPMQVTLNSSDGQTGVITTDRSASISYDFATTSSVSVTLGTLSHSDANHPVNTANVYATGVDTTVDLGGGDFDTHPFNHATVGDGSVQGIKGKLTILHAGSADNGVYGNLTLDASADDTPTQVSLRAYTSNNQTFRAITGLAPAEIDYLRDDGPWDTVVDIDTVKLPNSGLPATGIHINENAINTAQVLISNLPWPLEIDPSLSVIFDGTVALTPAITAALLAATPHLGDYYPLIHLPVFYPYPPSDFSDGHHVQIGDNDYTVGGVLLSTPAPGLQNEQVVLRRSTPVSLSLDLVSHLQEGNSVALTGTINETDQSVNAARYSVDWGDGVTTHTPNGFHNTPLYRDFDPSNPQIFYAAESELTHTYKDGSRNSYTVTVHWSDYSDPWLTPSPKPISQGSATILVKVSDQLLALPVLQPISAVEGQPLPDNEVIATANDPYVETDPNDSSEYQAWITWTNGQAPVPVPVRVNGGTVSVLSGGHVFDEAGAHTIQVSIQADDGDPTPSVQESVQVAEPNLTVTPLAPPATEGVPLGISGFSNGSVVASFHDPDSLGVPGDYTATIDWGDGTPGHPDITAGVIIDNRPFNPDLGVFGQHTYAQASDIAHGGTGYTMTVTVTDEGGGTGHNSVPVDVLDAPLTPGAALVNVQENTVYTGTVATFTDPNPNASASDFTAVISWGDGRGGVFSGNTSIGTITRDDKGHFLVTEQPDLSGPHVYAAAGNYPLSVTVTDVGGSTVTISGSAQVTDAPLSLFPGGSFSATEGLTFGVNQILAGFTDGNKASLPSDFQAILFWGDGRISLGTIVPDTIGTVPVPGAFNVQGRHAYAEAGHYVLGIQITDLGVLGGGVASIVSGTDSVTVADAKLTYVKPVTLTTTPVEGATFSSVVGTFHDANSLASAGDFVAEIDWGDHTTSPGVIRRVVKPATLNSPADVYFTVSGTHAYDEEGTYQITARVRDIEGSVSPAVPINVRVRTHVADAPLAVFGKTVYNVQGFAIFDPVASFTDPDPQGALGDYTATIDWGDGNGPVPGQVGIEGGSFVVTAGALHSYADGRNYTIIVTVTDHGQPATATSSADITDITQPPQVNPNFHVTEGGTQTIGVNDLYGVDDDPTDTDLLNFVYQVTTLPTLGELQVNGNTIGPYGTFSQGQINLGLVQYVSHFQDGVDSFAFSVAEVSPSVPSVPYSGTFTIQVDDLPALTVNTLNLTQLASTPITAANLKASDDDNDPDSELTFRVGTPPTSGQLVLTRPGQPAVVLGAHSPFTQDDIDRGYLSYSPHANGQRDTFSFSVTDGSSPASLDASLAILYDAPLTASNGFNLTANEDLPFSGTVAGFSDADTSATAAGYSAVIDWGDSNISKGTVSATGLGNFRVGGSHTYTAAGDYAVKVYIQDTGGASTVATGTAHVLDRAVLTVDTGLTLLYGTESSINDNMLLATDLTAGDPPSDLIYTLTAVPTAGNLQLDGQVLGAGSTFTQFNIHQGLLGYQSLQSADVDSFRFTVQDGTSGNPVAGTFFISIGGSPGFTEFAAHSPYGIVTGPDGNLWFTEYGSGKVASLDPHNGTIMEHSLPTPNARPEGITVGPDGAVWFTENAVGKIGRIAVNNPTVQEFSLPAGSTSPAGIATGADGNVWFTCFNFSQVGQIGYYDLTHHTIHMIDLPGTQPEPLSMTAGPDGNIWFTEFGHQSVAKITPDGHITEYPIPGADQELGGITAGPDGALWFTESIGNAIGRITTDGVFTRYSLLTLPNVPIGGPGGPHFAGATPITTGPDGNLYFMEYYANRIGRMTPAGNLTEIALPTAASHPYGVTAGPDGNIWFGERDAGKIGMLTLPIADGVSPIRSATGAPVSTAEGSGFNGTVATFQSLNPAATAGSFTAQIHWGDGTSSAGMVNALGGGNFSVTASHGYDEGGHYLVSTQIQAADNSVFETLGVATVTDLALAGMGHNVSVGSGLVFNQVLATFTDSDLAGSLGEYAALIDWGGGELSAGMIRFNPASHQYEIRGTHAFATAGTHSVRVIVEDADEALAPLTIQVRTR
jgi:streptogramin lyase